MNDAWNRLQPLLRQGEQIRWVGQPDPRVLFTPADAFLVPFSLLWGGFAMFWETQAITRGGPSFSALWGIPFVLMGLYMIFGRFIYKKRSKLKTVYGLTDARVIVSSSERSFEDVPLLGTPMRINRSHSGRHVSVIFGVTGRNQYQNTGLDFFFNRSQARGLAFFDVPDVDALTRELDKVAR
jgi:hypothetical protein